MADDRVKVLYIAGWGRSGSTILDNILDQLDGFFSVGELVTVWERNLIENLSCGCGKPFGQCEVWEGIFREAFGGMDKVDARKMIRLRNKGARARHVPLMLLPGGDAILEDRLNDYIGSLEKLYRGIQSETGAKVIVDSSKSPPYGYVLGMMPGIDLHVVHLVRDPRAVAYSWLRKKDLLPTSERPMIRYGAAKSTLIWNVWNLLPEIFWKRSNRYMFLRYEDFVDRPREAIERILQLVHESSTNLSFVNGREVDLKPNHTAIGNPSRFNTGTLELRMDSEWKAKMNPLDRNLSTALSWPLMLKYGYKLSD